MCSSSTGASAAEFGAEATQEEYSDIRGGGARKGEPSNLATGPSDRLQVHSRRLLVTPSGSSLVQEPRNYRSHVLAASDTLRTRRLRLGLELCLEHIGQCARRHLRLLPH